MLRNRKFYFEFLTSTNSIGKLFFFHLRLLIQVEKQKILLRVTNLKNEETILILKSLEISLLK